MYTLLVARLLMVSAMWPLWQRKSSCVRLSSWTVDFYFVLLWEGLILKPILSWNTQCRPCWLQSVVILLPLPSKYWGNRYTSFLSPLSSLFLCVHVHVHVSLCVYVFVYTWSVCSCVCRSRCVKVHSWKPEINFECHSGAIHLIFWDRVSHWDLGSLIRLGRMASKALESSCLCFPSLLVLHATHGWFVMWALGVELRSSCFNNKHFKLTSLPP